VLGLVFVKRIECNADMNQADPKSSAPAERGPIAAPRKSSSVARSAGIVSLAVMASRVLGLAREMVFAYFFGASKSFANDAYVIAFRIPNLLRDLFAEGALSSAFVPVFSDYLVNKDEKEAFRLSNLVATGLIVVLGVFVLLGRGVRRTACCVDCSGVSNRPSQIRAHRAPYSNYDAFHLARCTGRASDGNSERSRSVWDPGIIVFVLQRGINHRRLSVAALLTDPTFSHPIGATATDPQRGSSAWHTGC
jgi:hypothetical protein